eukprot:scaffold29_cov251-Pinguiococcus_pyrenoidosus.AAC.46
MGASAPLSTARKAVRRPPLRTETERQAAALRTDRSIMPNASSLPVVINISPGRRRSQGATRSEGGAKELSQDTSHRGSQHARQTDLPSSVLHIAPGHTFDSCHLALLS